MTLDPVQLAQRDYGARGWPKSRDSVTRPTPWMWLYPRLTNLVWVCLVHPEGVDPELRHNAFSVGKRGGYIRTRDRRPAPFHFASRQPRALLHDPVGVRTAHAATFETCPYSISSSRTGRFSLCERRAAMPSATAARPSTPVTGVGVPSSTASTKAATSTRKLSR